MEFKSLGNKVSAPIKELETFPTPTGVDEVTLTCKEFTSLCPVTGQPDFSTITINYRPNAVCLESKSLKLYLWTFREKGTFCEALSAEIAQVMLDTLQCKWVEVTINQASRGGIEIMARTHLRGNTA